MTATDFLIIAVVTSVVVPLISYAVNTTRSRRALPESDGRSAVLAYPRAVTILCIAMFALWLAMGVMIAFVLEPETELDRILGILVVIVPMTLVSLWLLSEAIGRRLAITDVGLETRAPWGTTVRVAWGEVEQLHYSDLCGWLVIRGARGVRVRASRYLNGTGDLCEALTQHVRPEVLARARRALDTFRSRSASTRGAA